MESQKRKSQAPEPENAGLAAVFSKLITRAIGTHRPSYRQGYREGYEKGKVAGKAATHLSQPHGSKPVRTELAIRLEDARSNDEGRVQFDTFMLGDRCLKITPLIAKTFRADAKAKLGDDHQPTEEQWAAILTPATACVTVGVAGTGKTFVTMMRAILLHHYLQIPLSEMTILAVSKDCRMDFIARIGYLFSCWGISISDEQCLSLVKTPRGVLLRLIRAIPLLSDVVPFELLGIIDKGEEDGRPFDLRLSPEQLVLAEQAYIAAYQRSKTFGAAVEAYYATTICLPKSSQENPKLVRYSELGARRTSLDEELSKYVTGLWHKAGHWPAGSLASALVPVSVMGSTFLTNAFLPELNAYVVLGTPAEVDRDHKRAGQEIALYEEMLAKRAVMQRFCVERVIWIDSPVQLQQMQATVAAFGNAAPSYRVQLKGDEQALTIHEALYQTGALIQTLGLNPASEISRLRFLPNDHDSGFYDCVAKFWPLFETYLLEQQPRVMTYDRLYMTFGDVRSSNLKAVSNESLLPMLNVLTDELQDITIHTGEFIKACIVENRGREHMGTIAPGTMSVFACGDDFQTAHGTQGATPRYLVNFNTHFPSKGFKTNLLGMNFRSGQGIIHAAHSLITGIPAVSTFAPASAYSNAQTSVELHPLDGATLMRLFDVHYGNGDKVLILAASRDDYRAVEGILSLAIERDKTENPNTRRVRVRAAQRAKGLEEDVVFIIGDFTAGTSTWAKNQLFRAAATVETEDQSPFDVIQQNELYRLAHIAITRARKKCYWLMRDDDCTHALKASKRIGKLNGYFTDKRE